MKKYLIYKHTNKINGKSYIGKTCQSVQERWRKDGIGYQKSSPIFWQAIQKYGWDNFEHSILEQNLSEKEVNEREKYWIKFYDCCVLDGKDKGYNIDRGGTGFSSELGSILSKQNWENEEYRKIFCKPVICVNTQKIYPSIVEAANATGINKSGIAKACNKIHHSAGTDSNNIPLQWEFYEEGKEYLFTNPKLQNKNLSKIICLTTGEIFDSISDASKKYGINHSCICGCFNGKQKTAGQLEDGTRLCWARYEENKEYKIGKTNLGKSHKKVICIDTNEIFDTIKEAAESVNRAASNMSAHLHGKQQSCGVNEKGQKMHFKFFEEDYE